jgi:hypothetical protein
MPRPRESPRDNCEEKSDPNGRRLFDGRVTVESGQGLLMLCKEQMRQKRDYRKAWQSWRGV